MSLKDALYAHPRFNKLKFIQVGANDGDTCDPLTKLIKCNKWKGILIEPVPQAFQQLKKTYSSCASTLIFENVAIHDVKNIATMHVCKKSTCLSSFNRRNGLLKGAKNHQIEKIKVKCCTLNSLLKKHGMEKIDFLCIDAEGSDYNVLKSINLSRYKPTIIYYEHKHLGKSKKKAEKYLRKYGYKLEFFKKTTLGLKC